MSIGLFPPYAIPNSCAGTQFDGGDATKASIAQRAHLPPATRGSLLSSSCRQSWQGPPSSALARRKAPHEHMLPAHLEAVPASPRKLPGASRTSNTLPDRRPSSIRHARSVPGQASGMHRAWQCLRRAGQFQSGRFRCPSSASAPEALGISPQTQGYREAAR